MRKVCAVVSLFVIVAAFALIGVRPVGTTSAGAATLSAQNGDVNGDGKIDIADGIYLLSWLFTGGPEPVACADSPDLAAQVGALTVAVQNLSQSIQESRTPPCGGRADRFVDNGDGTVTDSCSGLMWQKVQADIDGSGDFEPEADFATWEQANGFVKGLNIGGHSDWRLPTIQELEGILISDPAHLRAPAVDPLFAVYPVACWSSTPFQLQKAVPAYWTLAFGVSTAPAQPALSRGDTRKGVLAARGG